MRRTAILFSSATLTIAGFGCHPRCESGFISQGACVSYDLDVGVSPMDGGLPPLFPDATVDPPRFDGGGDPVPRPDGGVVDSGGGTMMGARGRILIRGAAVLTMNGPPIVPGEVYVEDGRIACVGGRDACEVESMGASVVESGGVILPGLIDAHNHVAYDWLDEWMPGRMWTDHQQWQSSPLYDDFVRPYDENKATAASFCAMVQWGEVRALVNGVTTIFGTPQPRPCYRWLVRNAELTSAYTGWPDDRMRSNTLGIDTVDATDAAAVIAAMDEGRVTAYMVHLAEGISMRAYNELTRLLGFGLLRSETVIIHGTAIHDEDWDMVAAAGSKLVWSPSSNMVLYGETTNVAAAHRAGVSIAIAPDWTPSGSDDALAEVRFARNLVEARWPGLFTDEDYVAMITRNPARHMAVDAHVGTLEVGKLADVLVLDVDPSNPYASVIEARPDDIQLLLLNGVPSYGAPDMVSELPDHPDACFDFDVCGTQRRACWADTPDGPVTPASIANVIQSFHPVGPSPLFDCR